MELAKNMVTILILIDGFLQCEYVILTNYQTLKVTILILIDGFLQLSKNGLGTLGKGGHNPYFNRWFSAIGVGKIMHII